MPVHEWTKKWAWFSFGYFRVTQANASGPQFSAVWRDYLVI